MTPLPGHFITAIACFVFMHVDMEVSDVCAVDSGAILSTGI